MKLKLIIFFLYFAFLFLLVTPWREYLLIVIGGLIGAAILILDELIFFQYYNDDVKQPKQSESDFAEVQQNTFAAHQDNNLFHKKTIFLATRSVLFLVFLAPIAFFVITSTGSLLGTGLVLGMALGIVQEMWLLHQDVLTFNDRFWSLVKTKLSQQQIKSVTLFWSLIFAFLTIIAVL